MRIETRSRRASTAVGGDEWLWTDVVLIPENSYESQCLDALTAGKIPCEVRGVVKLSDGYGE